MRADWAGLWLGAFACVWVTVPLVSSGGKGGHGMVFHCGPFQAAVWALVACDGTFWVRKISLVHSSICDCDSFMVVFSGMWHTPWYKFCLSG